MTHLDEGTIQALLHDELPPDARVASEAHRRRCPACRAELESARSEDAWIRGRMARLDVAVPDSGPDAILTRSEQWRGRSWRRAATIALLVGLGGVGVAWAIPALRSRIASLRSDGPPGTAAPEVVRSATGPAATRGLSVVPGDSFVVTFESRQDSGAILVAFVTAPELAVRTRDSSVSWLSHDNGLTVRNAGATGDHELDVPAAARYVEVRVGGRVVLRKRESGILSASPRDSAGRHVIDLAAFPR